MKAWPRLAELHSWRGLEPDGFKALYGLESVKVMYLQALDSIMAAQSVEEHLAELAAIVDEAERLGIDPWPADKPERPWAKWALGSFKIVLMLSAVSKVLFRFA